MTMRIGLRQPAFIGISSSTMTRKTYSAAARATGSGALKLFGCCGEVPVKSTVASRAARSTVIFTLMTAPWSVSTANSLSLRRSMTRRTLSAALS